MSDKKQKTQETITNIVREMRQGMDPNGTAECQYLESDICTLADRIEAAAKREKSETEADALNVGAIVATTEKSSAVGNASAMREALLKLDKLLYIGADGRVYGLHDKAGEIERTIKAALALPPRNCDVFRSEAEAKSAFIAYYNEAFDLKGSKYAIDTCDLKHDVDGILHDYIEWLFATAKSEAKVESNGSK